MDCYTLWDHFQKRVDVIVDRFYKQVGTITIFLTGITWSIFNADLGFKPYLTFIGCVVLAVLFLSTGVLRGSADKKIKKVQQMYETDYKSIFDKNPDQKLTGLFLYD